MEDSSTVCFLCGTVPGRWILKAIQTWSLGRSRQHRTFCQQLTLAMPGCSLLLTHWFRSGWFQNAAWILYGLPAGLLIRSSVR